MRLFAIQTISLYGHKAYMSITNDHTWLAADATKILLSLSPFSNVISVTPGCEKQSCQK